MKILVWIVQILVTLVFLAAGFMKLATPYAELMMEPNMAWVGDFSATQIKIIAALEILGAIGLIIPMFVTKLKMLVPVAAIGIALVMVGAIVTHLGRNEPIYVNAILFILTALVAWWRRDYFRRTT